MSTKFTVVATGKPDRFQDNVSLGDAVTYSFDFSPWAAENSSVSTVVWTVESGQCVVTGAAESADVATALITFSESGRNLVSLLATGASGQIKKVWLEVRVKDINIYINDYGMSDE